jgi:hypothetical protein
MTSALTLNSTTPRFDLPLLYAAQAQKEIVANEAFALTDALLHCAIEGSSATPPTTPVDGTNWLVATSATGDWAGHDRKLACRQSGNWVFVTPRDGMLVFNRTNGQWQHYSGAWLAPSLPVNPTGGSTVDDVARTAISALIAALQSAGILPSA